MAKVPLEPIGSPLEDLMDPAAASANAAALRTLNAALQTRRDDVRAGWGPEYVDRVHEKGRLTTWERIERLKDPATRVLPVGTLVNHGVTFGERQQTSPGAGVVTAFVRVGGRVTVVIANDNTVASGSWWPMTPEKIQRAQEIALRLRVPVIYLVDCSGLFLPEQGRTFPGKRGAGAIFKMNSLLSAAGVPQIAGVLGDCIAGGGYMPIISDVVYMTEQAYMVIAGAALIKGAKSQSITSLSIGGPDVHVHLSACADHRVPDDETCIDGIRAEVCRLPGSAAAYYRRGADPEPPRFSPSEIDAIMPQDHRMVYDIRQVIARLVDSSLFWEVMPGIGLEMICGVARIGGLYAGLVANNQQLTGHPDDTTAKRAGGILYREGIAKISAFSRACNDDGLPIVWLQDISGFDIGVEAEKQGLLGYGSSLIYTNSTNTTPMITLLLRKASGAGYYAMAGHPYDPVLQLSTPLTRLAVMEGRTLAIGAFRTRLDDSFNIVAASAEEKEKVRRGMEEVEARITNDMDPVLAARQMDTDEVVTMAELREYLETIVEASYQSCGYRRVKNSRIWSLHDLKVLSS
ncbi:MAG TPA: carboxyl transferase domain-containing protein [Patescibacteria group bacterium]|nr:carboxyl transferase domain-containing protein [Patescibacteria group bacterium]